MPDLSQLTPGTWNVDTAHSTVGFVARHLMIAKVRGQFRDFSGVVEIAPDPLDSKVYLSKRLGPFVLDAHRSRRRVARV